MRVHALFMLLGRHLASYAELGAAAAAEFRSACARRVLLLITGLIAALTGMAALWAAGLLALWETSWRLPYAIASAVLLLVVSIAALRTAVTARPSGPSAGVLRNELSKDLELLQQWKNTL